MYLIIITCVSGDEIVYHCKYGLSLEGSNTLICAQSGDNSASGIWLGDEPSCINADLRPFIGELLSTFSITFIR